jgi:hypothetical protein
LTATAGAATPPTLDGLNLLGSSAESWEIVETEVVGTVRMASGAIREQRLASSPGHPVIRRWYSITLDYRHLGSLSDAVEARMAFPGPHELAVWKHVTLGYLADGSLAEWSLPWRLAPHSLTPPAGAPPERFAPVIRLGWNAAALAPVSVDAATYSSGSPGSGEAWLDLEGRRFKVGFPPEAGTRIVAQVVPLFQMVVGTEDLSRQYRDWLREPRRIVLVETEAIS